ncbi:hypothetical protein ABDK09_17405 [Vibrio sp. CDRSL-10 TSBA]
MAFFVSMFAVFWLSALQGKARQGKARQGKARQGKARQAMSAGVSTTDRKKPGMYRAEWGDLF